MYKLTAFSLIFILAGAACGPRTRVAEQVGIACAKQDLSRDFNGLTLIGGVTDAIGRGADGWKDVLADLGAQAGEDALACAVRAARAAFGAQAPASGFGTSPAGAAAARAESVIVERRWRFAE